MNMSHTLPSTIGALVLALGCVSQPALVLAELRVGSTTVDITPPRPVALEGQFNTRVAQQVETPLVATILAVESTSPRSDQFIAVACDVVGIPDPVRDAVRARVRETLSEIVPEKVFLSATHTHTAPVVTEGKYVIPEEGVMTVHEYTGFLVDRIVEGIQKAWENRRPAKMGFGLGYAVIGRNRRAVYADGRAVMYGRTDSADFRRLESGEDPGVEVLFFTDQQERLFCAAINVACPSQEVEGRSTVHADFWHVVRSQLRELWGHDVDILGWCGAAGDQSPHLMMRKAAEERMLRLRGVDSLGEIARRLTACVADVWSAAQKDLRTDVEVSHQILNLDLPRRVVTEQEMQSARAEAEKLANQPNLRMKMLWHRNVVERFEQQQQVPPDKWTLPCEVHIIRLGDVAITTNPFEMFTDFGLQIKARSRAIQTFVIQLTGPGTYLATPEAVKAGGYSAVVESTQVSPEGGQILVDRTLEAVNRLF